jgi:DNA polymerase III epsilon subunit-like protein
MEQLPYRIIFYDFETTGLDINKDQPIEIGAIDDGGKSFHRLIRPVCPDGSIIPIAPIITDLTGLTAEKLESGVDINAAFDSFIKWILDTKLKTIFLVAHNGDRFDHLIFRKWTEGKINKYDNFKLNFLDTYVLAKLKFPEQKSFKLVDLAKQVGGFTDFTAHSALGDCMATMRIFEKLM